MRVRLAPSPTGTLHIGTARTAVFNWLFARHHGGAFLLRIEDTDKERSKPAYTANILEGLAWLGLNWDAEPVIQSERIEAHRDAISQLLASGHAYRCYATDDELTAMREAQAAAKQLLLYQALGLAVPEFAHTPLILNQEGKKLSKRDGVTSVSDFRAMGYTAEALANYMTLLGWSPPEGMGERFSLSEAAEVFGFDRVNRAGARFDWDKLNWLNGQVLHALPPQTLRDQLAPLWAERGWGTAGATADADWQLDLASLLSASLTLLADGVDQAEPFFTTPELNEAASAQLDQEGARPALAALAQALEQRPADAQLDAAAAQELMNAATAAAGVKKGVLMKSLRAALLGSLQGPDLQETWLLVHRVGEDLGRIRRCL